MPMHRQLLLLDLRGIAALGGACDGDFLLDGRREMQRQQPGDGLGILVRGAAGVFFRVNRHHHRFAIDHHDGGARLGLRGRARGVDGGDGIGEVETLSRPQLAGIEILAHGGNHGIGVLHRDPDIFQHARQRVARIQRDGAVLHTRVGNRIAVVRIVGNGRRLPYQFLEQGIGQGRAARRDQGMRYRRHARRQQGNGPCHHGRQRG